MSRSHPSNTVGESRTSPDAGPFRVAVVGGGIAGLAAAHRLGTLGRGSARTIEPTIFEAGPRLGGPLHTEHVDDFLVETGPDMFVTDKPWAVELVEELGLAGELIGTDPTHRRSLVLRRGKPQPVPPGFTLMSAARTWPVLVSPVLSPWGKARLAWERFVPAKRDISDESLADFARRRLGREAFERLVQPLVGGIYTADPEKLSLRATLPRFLDMEREHGSLTAAMRAKERGTPAKENAAESGARYGLFVTLRNGVGTLVNALAERVREFGTIRMQSPIEALRPGDDGYLLELRDGRTERFDAVVLATPSYVSAHLLESVDPDLSSRLGAIEYASSAVVCSGYRLDQSEHPLEAFGLVVPHVEGRRIIAVSMASRKFPGRAPDGHVLLRTFLGGALQPEVLERTDEELLGVVRGELADVFGLRGEPCLERVTRYERAMPQYHVGHLDRVDEIDRRVEGHPWLALAGSAYRGVGIPDCVHSGRLAAERIAASAGVPVGSG